MGWFNHFSPTAGLDSSAGQFGCSSADDIGHWEQGKMWFQLIDSGIDTVHFDSSLFRKIQVLYTVEFYGKPLEFSYFQY